MRRIIILAAVFVFLTSSWAFGFGLVEYSPLLSHYEVITTEDVILVFDSPIDVATAIEANVYLEPRDGGVTIPGTVSLASTNFADDTVVIEPTQKMPWALPLRIVISPNLLDTGAGTFDGIFPEGDWFVPNVPTDLERPEWDPANFTAVFVNSNVLLGFNPIDPEGTDPAKPWEIPGIWATEAWKIHTGRPDVIIAAVDNGLSSYDDEDLIERFFLNAAELPMPMDGGTPCYQYDCNGDGRFSVSDYANDPRLPAKDNLNPADLIEAFSDGVDDDGNGLPDDICGWDFFRHVNQVLGVREFREATHMSLSGKAVCAIAGNDHGTKPGICPDCTILPIRVSDAVIADLDLVAEGAGYGVDMGASVIMVALGAVDFNEEAMEIFYDAYEKDVITIAASGDELGYHHLYPAAGEDIVSVHGVLPIPAVHLGPLYTGDYGFLESYCTNYGAHIAHTVSTGACTSEAVGNGAGLAGLIYSWGLEQGYELTAGEVNQIMNMTADDVASHCLTFGPEMCKPGWDQRWGYGRVNAFESLKVIGWPAMGLDERIPPDVRVTSPLWWANIDPFVEPTLTVEGSISARGRTFDYEVQIAKGVEPEEEDFVVIGSGTSNDVNGVLAIVDLWTIFNENEVRSRPAHHDSFTTTIRVQATYTASDKSEVLGEARKAFAVFTDDDPDTGLMEGFPQYLGTSGEASPVLYDLDGAPDGRTEIILATSNGQVHALHYVDGEGYVQMDGFPVLLPTDRSFPDGIVGTPAVGPLFNDGVPIIVVATFMGHVYAIWPDGENHEGGAFLPGFPVSAYERPNDSSLAYGHGRSFLAAPVIADLDLDGVLEIIAANYDQYVYAWKPLDEDSDGEADMLPGWPVLARSEAGVVPGYKVCDYPLTAQILGTPAVGILEPLSDDPAISDHPAVVVPTGEVCSGGALISSRIYAIYHNGYDHPDGPFLPGWPAVVTDPFGDEIPIPPLTIGATTSPAIYRDEINDKTFIGVGTFFWFPMMLIYENEKLSRIEMMNSGMNMSVSANGTFGFMDDSDQPYYYVPTAGFLNRTDGDFRAESFNVSGWKIGRLGKLDFRKRLDDINFFINPNIADLDNDGLAEVISGSSGYIVHAWNKDGDIPAGWPKFTQNFHIGSVAVGDLDLDGGTDIVSFTHEGNLFAWRTLGKACRNDGLNAEWWSFHHDEHNTGYYGVDTIPPGMAREFRVNETSDPDVFRISFKSGGDDWNCGFAAKFDLRYTTESGVDLSDPAAFNVATSVDTPWPPEGGARFSFEVTAPGAKTFAIRSEDEAGLLSMIAGPAEPEPPTGGDDDDTAPDDDDLSDDDDAVADGDDEDDDEGCCG